MQWNGGGPMHESQTCQRSKDASIRTTCCYMLFSIGLYVNVLNLSQWIILSAQNRNFNDIILYIMKTITDNLIFKNPYSQNVRIVFSALLLLDRCRNITTRLNSQRSHLLVDYNGQKYSMYSMCPNIIALARICQVWAAPAVLQCTVDCTFITTIPRSTCFYLMAANV